MSKCIFFQSGTIGDDSIPGNVGEYIERDAVLFEPGKWNGQTFKEDTIDALVLNFNPEEKIPVQLDHSDSARDTVGYVVKLWKEAGKLMGRLRFIGAENIEKVSQGLWKKLSVGFSIKPKTKLGEVSIVPFPAVPTAQIFTKTEEVTDNMDPNKKTAEEQKSEFDKALQAKDEEISKLKNDFESVSKELEELKKKPDPKAEGEDKDKANLKADDKAGAEFVKMQQEMKATQDELAKMKENVRLREISDEVESLVEEGKTLPANAEAEKEFLKTQTGEQRASYIKLRKEMPNLVEFGARGKATEGNAPEKAQVEKEASYMMESLGYKFNKDKSKWEMA